VSTAATSPEDVIRRFALHLNEGDVDAALGLYETHAAFAPEPGALVHGRAAIREALERFAALRPTLTGAIRKVVVADGTALVVNEWRLSGTRPDGDPIAMGGLSADVLRLQGDGSWRVLIDDPWGGGV
jgi:ketosteroid isomerase-like protein